MYLRSHYIYSLFVVSITFSCNSFAGDWAGALNGFGKAMEDIADQAIEKRRQEELMRYQMQLELQKQQILLQNQQKLEMERQQLLENQRQQQQRAEEIAKEQAEALAKEKKERQQQEAKAKESQIISSISEQAQQTQLNKSEEVISKVIPNWKSIVGSESFSSWFYKQPSNLQLLADSDDPNDGITLIRKYQLSKK